MEIAQEMQNENMTPESKKADLLFRFSIGIFVFVILSTIGLYLYKMNIDSSLDDLNTQISSTDKSISDLKKDKKLQVYNLYNINKTKIESDLAKSNVNTYINFLKLTASKYSLQFSGFNYDTKKLSTSLTANTDTNLGYLKLVKFIGDFRTTTNDLVELSYVSTINGTDKITTNIDFNVK